MQFILLSFELLLSVLDDWFSLYDGFTDRIKNFGLFLNDFILKYFLWLKFLLTLLQLNLYYAYYSTNRKRLLFYNYFNPLYWIWTRCVHICMSSWSHYLCKKMCIWQVMKHLHILFHSHNSTYFSLYHNEYNIIGPKTPSLQHLPLGSSLATYQLYLDSLYYKEWKALIKPNKHVKLDFLGNYHQKLL